MRQQIPLRGVQDHIEWSTGGGRSSIGVALEMSSSLADLGDWRAGCWSEFRLWWPAWTKWRTGWATWCASRKTCGATRAPRSGVLSTA